MIRIRIEIGEKELSVLREIMLASPKNIRKRKAARIYGRTMHHLWRVVQPSTLQSLFMNYGRVLYDSLKKCLQIQFCRFILCFLPCD